jgi:transposase
VVPPLSEQKIGPTPMRDLLDCVWPAALDTARQPFRSRIWIAALSVVIDRDGSDFGRTRRLGAVRFEHAVRRLILSRGGQKPCLRIVEKIFTALTDPAGAGTSGTRCRKGLLR